MTRSPSYAPLTVAAALLTFAIFVGVAIWQNAGVFEYPLDDVYIHLAMAEQIANGGYGINAGEVASASSSPIWPFLLAPFSGTVLERWIPLVLNVIALVAAAALFGRILGEARLGRAGAFFAVLAPFALGMYTVAYSGMENMAHGAASLAIILGLWLYVETGRIGWLLVLGVILAPAFRIEGLALALVAAALVIRLGRLPAGLGLIVIGLAPVVGFVVFLLSLGLEPLPSSVTAKLAETGGGNVIGKFLGNSGTYGGRLLLVLSVMLALVSLVFWNRDIRRAYFGLGIAAAGLAHLAFGSVGWLDRYETYAVFSVAAALALLASDQSRWVRSALMGLILLAGVLTYAPYVPNNLANMRAIHLQHAEMSRFAKDHVQAPVAVSDLGYVAWRNPDYVLDFWGLATPEALTLRLSDECDGWMDRLADDRNVQVAMIYDRLFVCDLADTWVPLGSLWLEDPGRPFLGGPEVAFYARTPDVARSLANGLRDWAETLPAGARFDFDGGGS